MKSNTAVFALLTTAALAFGQSTQPSTAPATTAPSAALSTLLGYAGTWTLAGNWANGDTFKARQSAETVLNGRFLHVRTWSASRDAAETERDIALYGQQDGRVVKTVFTPDGQSRQIIATPTTDGTIQFDWTKIDGKGKTLELREVITPIDANTYGWRTMMHKGGEWHTLIKGEWKRA